MPFGLHHPLWIEDPDFDLDYHIRGTALPSPGTREQLSTLVGRLVALPLDRTRPLWEVWVIEGLEDGNVAVLTKVHHAAIDGASGNELTVALLDLTPEIAEHEPEEEWVPDRVPTDVELLGYAATSLARQPRAGGQGHGARRPAPRWPCAAATGRRPSLDAAARRRSPRRARRSTPRSRRAGASPSRPCRSPR